MREICVDSVFYIEIIQGTYVIKKGIYTYFHDITLQRVEPLGERLNIWFCLDLVWMVLDGFGWVWMGLVGFGWVGLGLVGFGWVWLGLDGLGWVGFGLDFNPNSLYWIR